MIIYKNKIVKFKNKTKSYLFSKIEVNHATNQSEKNLGIQLITQENRNSSIIQNQFKLLKIYHKRTKNYLTHDLRSIQQKWSTYKPQYSNMIIDQKINKQRRNFYLWDSVNQARKQIFPHSTIQNQFQSNQNQNKLSETIHILPCSTKR